MNLRGVIFRFEMGERVVIRDDPYKGLSGVIVWRYMGSDGHPAYVLRMDRTTLWDEDLEVPQMALERLDKDA